MGTYSKCAARSKPQGVRLLMCLSHGDAATALYPRLLPSSGDGSRDITIQKALSGPHTLRVGLVWWAFGMCLALMYFGIVYRMFKGKVSLESSGYEH